MTPDSASTPRVAPLGEVDESLVDSVSGVVEILPSGMKVLAPAGRDATSRPAGLQYGRPGTTARVDLRTAK